MSVRIAVVADTHFRPPTVDAQRAYPSDAIHNERSARAVAAARALQPDAIVHLGDVVHPLPVNDAEHAAALAVARATTDGVDVPLIVVPGNHDVGDKPRAWEIAPTTSAGMHRAFRDTWGAPWRAVTVRGVRMISLDTPIFGTDSPMEHEQWAWFQRELADGRAAGLRLVVLLHYPPYVAEPTEPEHYDNLGQPGRARLLEALVAHGVEVVLCGHVHHPFFDVHHGVAIYILPSTAFTRPEYAELSKIEPAPERGRDDAAKLGFLVLHMEDDGTHRVEWVRTGHAPPDQPAHPALAPGRAASPASPVGVFLRDDWSTPRDVPYGSLDELVRKRARPDAAVFALFELGVRVVRIPWSDLEDPQGRRRMEALASHGVRALVFTAGAPSRELAARVEAASHLVAGWEILGSRGRVDLARAAIAALPAGVVPRYLSAIGEYHDAGAYHSHFPPHGFRADEAEAQGGVGISGVVMRVAFDEPVLAAASRAVAAASGQPVVLHVELPRRSEAEPAEDDVAAAHRAAQAALVAHALRPAALLLDPFVDLDRGYWPRRGLLDRRWNPRMGAEVLRSLARVLAGAGEPAVALDDAGDRWSLGPAGAVHLGDGAPAGVDLVTGRWVPAGSSRFVWVPA
jgi:predicted phosphodiesterase